MSPDNDHNSWSWCTNSTPSVSALPMPAKSDELMGNLTTATTAELTCQKANTSNTSLSGLELSFFDFEPHDTTLSNPSSGSGWSQQTVGPIWLPANNQPISPPDSAVGAPPKSWPIYDYHPQLPLRIPINFDATKDLSPPDQITSPDDENPISDAVQQLPLPTSQSNKSKKNTRKSSATPNPTHMSKRARRNASWISVNTENLDPNHSDEIRQSKFLERNRVAASKCRQKKKQWIENLEAKARKLHFDNSTMNLIIGSYRSEVDHLRAELAKHHHCGYSKT